MSLSKSGSVTELLMAFLAGRARAPFDGPAFAARLCQRLNEAVHALPVARLDLAAALGERAPSAEALAALESMHVGDVALTLLAARGETKALTDFDRLLVTSVRAGVASIDASESFLDEVTQVVRERLLMARNGEPPRLLDYSGRGPLAKWLRVSAIRTAISLRRGAQQTRTESEDVLLGLAAPASSPDLELLRRRYRTEFREAFAASFGVLSSQQRNLLRLHYLEDATLAQLAQHYGLHRTTVARHLDQARQVLFDDTRRRLAERLRLGREEFETLAALLRSQLDVTLRRFLKQSRA